MPWCHIFHDDHSWNFIASFVLRPLESHRVEDVSVQLCIHIDINALASPHLAVLFLKTPLAKMRFLQTLSTCVLALSSVVGAASFSNPLKKTDGSDPHIVYTGGYYYLMTTTWTNLKITRAKTIDGLKTGETRTVWTDTNANRNANMWAVSSAESEAWMTS
jgi:hypothetical protein